MCCHERKEADTGEKTFLEIIPTYVFIDLKKTWETKCTHLRVNDILSDPAQLLETWSDHFRILAESQIDTEPELKELQRQQVSLLLSTFQMEETFLDTSFIEDEVRHTVQKMKLRKSAGTNDLVAEHLRYEGGHHYLVHRDFKFYP